VCVCVCVCVCVVLFVCLRDTTLRALTTMQRSNPLYGMVHAGLSPGAHNGHADAECLYESPLSKELDRAALRLGRVVGRGEFGLVHDGLVCV
jgi:hypothetical protein